MKAPLSDLLSLIRQLPSTGDIGQAGALNTAEWPSIKRLKGFFISSRSSKRSSKKRSIGNLISACFLSGLFFTGLAGCAGASVEAPIKFPVPVVKKLPITMGLVLSDELTNYVHEEKLENNGSWSIDIGAAQQPMFENLFLGLFTNSETLPKVDSQSPRQNGVIVPNITQVQFAIPSQTRTDYFEVWIQYQIQLFDEQTLIAEWPITAYGKANVRNYGLASTSPALTAAARAACRDAMAFFAVEFGSDPKIKAWLDNEISNQESKNTPISS